MPAPNLFGNLDIARRIKTGTCRMMIVGDSLQGLSANQMIDAILRTWRPNYFNGFTWAAGTTLVSGAIGYTNNVGTWGANTSFDGWSGSGGPNSLPIWMYASTAVPLGRYTTFNGGAVGADHPQNNRCAEWQTQLVPTVYPLNWLYNRPLRCSYTTINNSLGINAFRMKVRNRFGSLAYGEETGLSAETATPTFQTIDIDLAATAYTGSSDEPVISIHPEAGMTTVNGTNLVHVIGRVRATDYGGLELMPHGIGSSAAANWGGASAINQTMQDGWVQAAQIDTVYIWLGQNDAGTATKAQYKAYIQTIIDRFIVSNPAMQFVLVSPYQTNTTSWSASGLGNSAEPYADALHEIAQAMPDRCLFINLWKLSFDSGTASSKYSYLNSYLLTDSVHPNTQGYYAFASMIWSAIESAASMAPAGAFSYSRFARLKPMASVF